VRSIDPAALAPAQRHRLLAGLVRPHSVAVVSTADADGRPLVAPLGYCLPLHARDATVGVTLAAVRDAGGEPELVRAAALARGELVVHLTTGDLAGHLAELARAERDPATGAVRWPPVASRRVSVPSLATGRARLECRVRDAAGPPGAAGVPAVRSPGRSGTSPTEFVLIAEVVCVVAEDDQLAGLGPVPAGGLPAGGPGPVPAGRAEFPWFLGPADGSVVDGSVVDGSVVDGSPVDGSAVDGSAGPGAAVEGPVTRR
jgi:flavin reductase (DIM6/NTAB) family NADH-FMN oxidoreductase RutF